MGCGGQLPKMVGSQWPQRSAPFITLTRWANSPTYTRAVQQWFSECDPGVPEVPGDLLGRAYEVKTICNINNYMAFSFLFLH